MMFGVTGIPIGAQLGLDSTEFGVLTATPVLTGALFRIPLGMWADRFGGRIIMLLLLVGCAVPLWVSSYATQFWKFLLLGLALGLVGASFSVGTPCVTRFFFEGAARLRDGLF
jgi:NNP family nitrate/nitrite transporter-like MFS transporter